VWVCGESEAILLARAIFLSVTVPLSVFNPMCPWSGNATGHEVRARLAAAGQRLARSRPPRRFSWLITWSVAVTDSPAGEWLLFSALARPEWNR